MVQVSYAVWHFQTPYSGFSVLFERRTGRYELTWSESTTLEGSGHRPKNIHVLQHWVLHMFAFMTQSSAFVCICCCICCGIFLHLLWHFFAFIVAFLCIYLLWHFFAFAVAFVLLLSTMFYIYVCKCTDTKRKCWNKWKHKRNKCKCRCKYICK